MRNFLSLSILIFLLTSCYEKQEGCLDIRARNYDWSADEPCEDCCIFPSMKLNVIHTWGDTTLMDDIKYGIDSGDSIQVLEIAYFLSGISLQDDNEEATVTELMEVTYADGTTEMLADNVEFISTKLFNFTVGSFDKAKGYDGLVFTLGVDGRYESEDLGENAGFYDEETYTYTNFRMQYVYQQDTLLYAIEGPEMTVNVELNAFLDLPIGTDFTIPVIADYEKLLQGISLEELQSGAADDRFKANMGDLFRF